MLTEFASSVYDVGMKMTDSLADLGEFSQGLSYSRYKTDRPEARQYRVLQVTDLEDGRIAPPSRHTTTEALDLTKVPGAIATPGLIVMSLRGATFRAATVPTDLGDAIVGNNLVSLRVRPDVLPDFALLLLRSKPVRDQLDFLATGSTLPQVSLSKFKTIGFHLPSKVEQEALVQASQALQEERQAFEQVMSLRELKLTQHLQHFIPGPGALS